MKESKWMQLPRSVVIGHGVLSESGTVCRKLKLDSPVVIITGTTTRKIAGDKMEEILSDARYSVNILEIDSNPGRVPTVEEIRKTVSRMKASALLGVGGGRIIDVAKFVSTQMGIPFLSVPTAASHDGIASFLASINDDVSVPAQAPLAIIADTAIISSAPKRLMVSGCGDIISNYTAVRDWQLANKLRNTNYSEYAAALSRMTAKIIVDNASSIKPGLEESVRTVVKALVSSGVAMSIAGSSCPASGSEHKFSHALDRIAHGKALHGEQCGVGSIMMMYLHGGDWRSIQSSLREIGAPASAKELGIDDECIIEALVHAHEVRPKRYTILGPGLARDAAENLASETEVI
jgi:glycerol-1-phosphate dehydrogenase [NAD(P)+]